MFRKLRLRLTAVCAVSTGLVLVGMALASLYVSTGQLEKQSEEAFESNLNTVFFYLRGGAMIDHVWLGQTESADDLFISIQLHGKQLMYTSGHPRRAELTAKAAEIARTQYGFESTLPPTSRLQADVVRFTMNDGDAGYRAAAAAVPGTENWFSVIVLKSTAREKAQVQSLRAAFALCVAIALGCLAAVAWVFTAWAVRPVRENGRRQAEFISAASHELRSPLAVMRVSAETIRTAPPEKAGYLAGKIERECDRLSRLTDDLLRLAGADREGLAGAAGGFAMEFDSVEPETVALTVGERFEGLAAQKGVHLTVELPDEPLPRVRCDGERVGQLLAILLDNAVRYTPAGGSIRLTVSAKRRSVSFSVADSGPGIPDGEKERVFERFYRGDASRTGKEHYGLGLAVAAEIARLHRGTLTLGDSEAGGAHFTLTLPL